jgi:hypothetical protein
MVQRAAEARFLVAAEASLLRNQSSAVTQLLAFAPLLFSQDASSPGHTSLLGRLHETAVRARVRVGRTEPLRDSIAGGFRRVRVRLEAQADVRGLTLWLAALESGRPRVRVEQIVVAADNPFAIPDAPEVLRIEVVAVGWTVEEGRQ